MSDRAQAGDERVGGRALLPLAQLATEHALDVQELVAGTGLTPAQLHEPPSRVAWSDFVTLTERVRGRLGGDALRVEGRRMAASSAGGALSRVASLLASPAAMYAMAPRLGLSTLFPMVEGTYTRIGPTRSRIEAHIPAGYASCEGFFEVTAGNFESLPELIGQPAAVVTLSSDGRTGVFTIEHGISLTIWARLGSIWKILFSANSLFDELTERNTELARELAESASARARADRAVAAQNDLLTAVSHELRTPIGEMHGLIDLAKSEGVTTPAGQYLDAAQAASRRLTHTVDLLIQVAALGEASGEAAEQVLDLGPWLHEVIEAFEHPAIRRTLRAPAPGEAVAWVATDWLRTITSELVSNAYRFTESGQVTIDLELVETDGGDAQVQLRVEDTGVGIEASWLERVFEPFVQAESGLSRRAQGIGLGLTVTRSMVDRLGGKIALSSTPGVGTKVEVTFPVKLADASEIVAEAKSSRPSLVPTEVHSQPPVQDRVESTGPAGAEPRSVRLLVVDDNPVNRMVLKSMGQRLGYVVSDAESGEAALEALSHDVFDLVFMDVQMPGLDGLQTTERMRADPGLKDLPIIAVTAQVAPGDEARCRRAGMDAYVPKPVEVHRLRAAVDEAVHAAEGRRLQRAS